MNEKKIERKGIVGWYFAAILVERGLLAEEQAEKILKRFLLTENNSAAAKDSGNAA